MSLCNPRRFLGSVFALAFTMFTLSPLSFGQSETTLFTFPDGTTTTNPYTLISDGHGNFFGTAIGGNGSVFEVSPAVGGGWTVTTIYAFPGATGPYYPEALVMDPAGNLFGANNGGSLANVYGEIYKLSPNGQGGWTYSTIYQFHGSDGIFPQGSLLLDSAGNLYGTTNEGGQCTANSKGCGLVYELSLQSDGKWKEKILYHFGAFSGDGQYPLAGLVFDSKGNLYGTTAGGGLPGCPNSNSYCGTVFELITNGTLWKEKILFRFHLTNGQEPKATPAFDTAGNLYGTTAGGGANLYGLVYQLTPTPKGEWTLHIVHDFSQWQTGAFPEAGVTFDAAGNIYVPTQDGGVNGPPCSTNGTAAGCGTVWKFTPTSSGTWDSKLLYVFTGGADGRQLNDQSLVLDGQGNIFGVALYGGDANSDGTIFEITP